MTEAIYRNVKIYEPDMGSKNHLEAYDSKEGIKESDYTLTYEGLLEDTVSNVKVSDKPKDVYLESLFQLFNTNKPAIHKGHSMSVGDIVVIDDKYAYYCQPIGFKEIPNPDASKIKRLENIINVVYVEPGVPAYKTFIGNDLKSMQAAVGGYIEPVYLQNDDVCLVGNDGAKILGMQGNRQIEGIGIMAGPFFIVSDGEENFESLSDELIQKYVERFAEPEDISYDEVQADMGISVYGFDDFLASMEI